MTEEITNKLDELADNQNGPVALHLKQHLLPVEGEGAVIFPPTYADSPMMNQRDFGYNIDTLSDGTKIATIDSVGSQANRMETIFLPTEDKESDNRLAKLVPQIEISYGEGKSISILETGHRLGDALIRSTNLKEQAQKAFLDFLDYGNYTKLAKLAPTSLVFGVWDSRDTMAKIPRIVSATIRAENIDVLTRSAQFNPALDYSELDVFSETVKEKQQGDTKSPLAKRGFVHVPAVKTHGGIRAKGPILRNVTINLIALRRIRGQELRRYILGLSLVAATTHIDGFLRAGCLLTLDPNNNSSWHSITSDGKRTPVKLEQEAVIRYAETVAAVFGVGEDQRITFDKKLAIQDSKLKTAEQ